MIDSVVVKVNRGLALYHLRNNPKNRKWGKRFLYNKEEETYCSLGLIAEGFGLPLVGELWSDAKNYEKLDDLLGIRSDLIWLYNDRGHDYKETADHMEELFAKYPVKEDEKDPEADSESKPEIKEEFDSHG